MTSLAESRADRPEFIFVGDHPAIDFANTLSMSQGQLTEHFRVWADVLDWLSLAGLSTEPALQIPTSRSPQAVKSVVQLRRAWKAELDELVGGGKVSDNFMKQLNHLLAEDVFHETLYRSGKIGFHIGRSASQLSGEKLALAILSRQIAHFLAGQGLVFEKALRERVQIFDMLGKEGAGALLALIHEAAHLRIDQLRRLGRDILRARH